MPFNKHLKRKTEDTMVVTVTTLLSVNLRFVAIYIKSRNKLLLLLQLHFATNTLAVWC